RAERIKKVWTKSAYGRAVEGPRESIHGPGSSGSFPHALSSKQHFLSPVFGQVCPARIHLLNQSNLLGAPPALDLLFSGNGHSCVLKTLVINQAVAFVLTGEALDLTCLVLHHAGEERTCDASVQRAGEARH